MSNCKFAEGWINKEGFFTPTVDKNHPWYEKIVCCDWDAFCSDCMDIHLMKDCVHWSQKEQGECPWEANPDNCNGCQDYMVRSSEQSTIKEDK